MKKSSLCIHGGSIREPSTRGINSPIYTSSAYEYLDREDLPYPRYFNTPNQSAVIQKLALLEGTEDGLLFSSGMAAISTVLFSLLRSGDHVVLQDELYGGTFNLVMKEFKRQGIDFTLVSAQAETILAAVTDDTRCVYLESPTNPLLTAVDLKRITLTTGPRGVITVVDSTFASPINQNPAEAGVDITIHSGTKYLAGHSDLCCGAALASAELILQIRNTARNYGGSLNATDCYLLERSLKTLHLRVTRQSENALALAKFLQAHEQVSQVYYPGLESHPTHLIAKSQMSGFGAMLSFELHPERIDATNFIRRLELITPALSLGGVESTICSPAVTSHRNLSDDERAQMRVTDRLLRLSVGIEDVDDLKQDICQAFGT